MASASGPVRAAIGLVLLYAALTTLSRLRGADQWFRAPAEDEISRYERRMLELRKVLPPRGIVGYVTDPPVQDSSSAWVAADAHDRFKAYLLTQYVLAPRVLVEGTEPQLVVGNFREQGAIPVLPGFRTVREFGRGVVLYRRVPP